MIQNQIVNMPQSKNMTDAQLLNEVEIAVKTAHPEIFGAQNNYGALGSGQTTKARINKKPSISKKEIDAFKNTWGQHHKTDQEIAKVLISQKK
jgi:hypothetical protein